MCGGTDAQPQVYSWGLSREPPDTLTEQDLRPCQTGQRPEKPATPQLWRLLGLLLFQVSVPRVQKAFVQLTAANDSLPCCTA